MVFYRSGKSTFKESVIINGNIRRRSSRNNSKKRKRRKKQSRRRKLFNSRQNSEYVYGLTGSSHFR
jgi:hypothetical protein